MNGDGRPDVLVSAYVADNNGRTNSGSIYILGAGESWTPPSGYVREGYVGVHAFGGAPAVGGGAYWRGWDIARDLVLYGPTDSPATRLTAGVGFIPSAACRLSR